MISTVDLVDHPAPGPVARAAVSEPDTAGVAIELRRDETRLRSTVGAPHRPFIEVGRPGAASTRSVHAGAGGLEFLGEVLQAEQGGDDGLTLIRGETVQTTRHDMSPIGSDAFVHRMPGGGDLDEGGT